MNAWRRFAEAIDLEIDRGAAAGTFADNASAFELFEKGGGFGHAVFEHPAGKLADMGIFSKLFGTAKGADAPVEHRLESLRRPCWIPVVEEGDGDTTASKLCGIPYLRPDEAWPVCPNCGKPIQLFVQLNSEDLPDKCGKPWGDGLLQFFYCTTTEPLCEVDCAAWGPHSKSTLLRVIESGEGGSRYQRSPISEPFPAKLITGWNEQSVTKCHRSGDLYTRDLWGREVRELHA